MKLDYDIIRRYLEDRGNLQDKIKIIDWFNDLQAEKELMNKTRQYWDEIPENIDALKNSESVILGNIYRRIKMEEAANKPGPAIPGKILNYITRIAAILFIPLLIFYFIKNEKQPMPAEITYSEVFSPPGSRTMFYLPDGSKGWLNSDSYLLFPEHFIGKNRTVSLKGEAYFDIVTDPDKPFIVNSKNLIIEAKGTSFNVRSWEDDPYVKVVLVKGNMEVSKKTEGKRLLISRLKPGQLLHYTPQPSGDYIKNVDAEKYTAWTEGKMVFREDPFVDVVERLNRWYNVNIIIKDKKLEAYKYVATFQDETLFEILEMLKISAPIEYKNLERKQREDGTFDKRTIYLYYKPKS